LCGDAAMLSACSEQLKVSQQQQQQHCALCTSPRSLHDLVFCRTCVFCLCKGVAQFVRGAMHCLRCVRCIAKPQLSHVRCSLVSVFTRVWGLVLAWRF
jgi:hypothetical protein